MKLKLITWIRVNFGFIDYFVLLSVFILSSIILINFK